jgi:hypothetical protein
MADPKLSLPTTAEFMQRFRDRCITITAGKLSDFAPASVLTLLSEVLAESIAVELQAYLDEVFPKLVMRSWEYLGFTPIDGAKAVATVRVLLATVNSQSFAIPRGYRFAAGGQTYETTIDLLIPANLDTANPTNYPLCRVQAIALTEGTTGNQSIQQCQIVQPVVGLAGLFFDEPATGGRLAEAFDEFADRVAAALRSSVGDPNEAAVVTVTEHETATRSVLGAGAVAIAIPERNLQGQNETAAMTVYALAPGGTPPTEAQLSLLLGTIAPRAPLATGRLYYGALPVSVVNIDVSLKALPTGNLEAIATTINEQLRSAFGLVATVGMIALDINRAVQILYDIPDVDYGECYWGFQGDPVLEARRLQIPFLPGSQSKTNAVRVGTVQVIFSTGLKRTFNQ